MSVSNDTRRTMKQANQPIAPKVRPERVVLPWLMAVDLGLALHAPELRGRTGCVPYRAAHPDLKVRPDGLEVTYEGFRLAVNAAPRHVRRRVLKERVKGA